MALASTDTIYSGPHTIGSNLNNVVINITTNKMDLNLREHSASYKRLITVNTK